MRVGPRITGIRRVKRKIEDRGDDITVQSDFLKL
jgi:hypothetical protein